MKCATGVAMGTKIQMNRLAAELCGVPAASFKNMGDKLALPTGDVQGFSILKVDPKTNSVYGTFSSGTKIFGPGVYDFTALVKWAKGKHHHCYVKLTQGKKRKVDVATPKVLAQIGQVDDVVDLNKKQAKRNSNSRYKISLSVCLVLS